MQLKEVNQAGDETIIIDKEISDKLDEIIWDDNGQHTYEYKGKLNYTYYVRIKVRHGYDQNLPTATYKSAPFNNSTSDNDIFWNANSLHYTYDGPNSGWSNWSDGIKIIELMTVEKNIIRPPSDQCIINYNLKKDSSVKMRVFNLMGELVETLVDKEVKKGEESAVSWDGTDKNGNTVASGVYYINIQAGDSEDTKKAVIVK